MYIKFNKLQQLAGKCLFQSLQHNSVFKYTTVIHILEPLEMFTVCEQNCAVCFQQILFAAQESRVSAHLCQTPLRSISQVIGQQRVDSWLSAISRLSPTKM